MGHMDHATVMNNCDAKAGRVGLAALSDIERVVALVSTVNFEVELGGLSSFFYNSAGDHAGETVLALEAVGAVYAAKALREAVASIPDGISSSDRVRRYTWWQGASDSLAMLDEVFAQDRPDVFSRLCSYIDLHADELREHG